MKWEGSGTNLRDLVNGSYYSGLCLDVSVEIRPGNMLNIDHKRYLMIRLARYAEIQAIMPILIHESPC
jgi:hypothetical protein